MTESPASHAASAPALGQRRLLTLLFVDLSGSTAMAEWMEAEQLEPAAPTQADEAAAAPSPAPRKSAAQWKEELHGAAATFAGEAAPAEDVALQAAAAEPARHASLPSLPK